VYLSERERVGKKKSSLKKNPKKKLFKGKRSLKKKSSKEVKLREPECPRAAVRETDRRKGRRLKGML